MEDYLYSFSNLAIATSIVSSLSCPAISTDASSFCLMRLAGFRLTYLPFSSSILSLPSIKSSLITIPDNPLYYAADLSPVTVILSPKLNYDVS